MKSNAICICPPRSNSVAELKQDRIEGGLAIVYKEDLNITKNEVPKYQNMKLAEFKIKPCTSLPVTSLTIIYRPPDSKVLSFLQVLSDYLESISLKMVRSSCFNSHISRADNVDAN